MKNSEGKPIINITERNAQQLFNPLNQGQTNTQPSLTVEGLSESLETILERFQRGQVIRGAANTYYDSDVNESFESEEPFSPKDYDLSDMDKARQLAVEAEENLRRIKKSAADKKEAERQKKLEQEIIAKHEQLKSKDKKEDSPLNVES